ncbi:MAG: transglutaminase-like domain-containing protein [Planctomycetota bacterium]|nr:transglutaminase-like domain-containing protein [Planctomycetota bacterium]
MPSNCFDVSLLMLLILGLLSVLSPLQTRAQAAERESISTGALDAFERGQGAFGVMRDPDGKGVVLYDRLLLEDDGPGAHGYNPAAWYKLPQAPAIELQGATQVKKVLHLERAPALSARLFLHSTGRGAKVSINGKPVDGSIVPVDLLKAGENEIVLAAGEKPAKVLYSRREELLLNDPARKDQAPRSFVSQDGGKTWKPLDGECRVRLHLFQYAAEGHFLSPALYLGATDGKAGALREPLSVKGLALKAEAETPKGGAVELFVRTGASPVPGEASWSGWTPARESASVPDGHAYAQWKAVLRTTDPCATPVLKRVNVEVDAERAAPAWAAALKVAGARNEELRYTSMPFAYEDYEHPKLKALREKYKLEEVVKDAKSEFEAQVLLREWVKRRWKYDPPVQTYPGWDADEIIQGQRGFCVQFAIVYVQCCLALGHEARFFFGYHPGGPGSGHEICEVWSNEHRKWILMDANQSIHQVDAATNVPLSMTEVQERMIRAMYGDKEIRPENLIKSPVYAADMRTCWRLEMTPKPVAEGEVPKKWEPWYKWLNVRYVPRNDWYANPRPLPYEQGFHWDWTGYWVWEPPRVPKLYSYGNFTARDADINWTLNQVCFDAAPEPDVGSIRIQMGTVTPNFESFLVNVDGKGWEQAPASHAWKLHPGRNRIEMRVRRKGGVAGPVSFLELDWNGAGGK